MHFSELYTAVHLVFYSSSYILTVQKCNRAQRVNYTSVRNYTYGEMTSQCLWSRYDRHFVGITRHNALSKMAKIYRVIQIKLNQLV